MMGPAWIYARVYSHSPVRLKITPDGMSPDLHVDCLQTAYNALAESESDAASTSFATKKVFTDVNVLRVAEEAAKTFFIDVDNAITIYTVDRTPRNELLLRLSVGDNMYYGVADMRGDQDEIPLMRIKTFIQQFEIKKDFNNKKDWSKTLFHKSLGGEFVDIKKLPMTTRTNTLVDTLPLGAHVKRSHVKRAIDEWGLQDRS